MLREDSLIVGIAIGIVVPVLAYLLIESTLEALGGLGITNRGGEAYSFRERTLALIAVCGNLLPFRYFASLRNDSSMRGIFLATGIYAIAWIVIFGIDLLGQ